jgi:hypothetical protein
MPAALIGLDWIGPISAVQWDTSAPDRDRSIVQREVGCIDDSIPLKAHRQPFPALG